MTSNDQQNQQNQENHSLIMELRGIINKLTEQLKDKDFELQFANLKIEDLEKNLQLGKNKFSKLKKLYKDSVEELNKLKGETPEAALEASEISQAKLDKIENLTELKAKKPAKTSSLKKSLDRKCMHIKDQLNSVRCGCCAKLREEIVETLTEMQENVLYFHDRMVGAQFMIADLERKNDQLYAKNEKLTAQMHVVVAKAAARDEKIAAVRDFYEGLLEEWRRIQRKPQTPEMARIWARDAVVQKLKFVRRELDFYRKQFMNFMKNFNFASETGKFREIFEMIEVRGLNVVEGMEGFLERELRWSG